jgi:prophage regulatory protein
MTADRLLPIADVERASGFHRSTLYRKIAAGEFPPPVQIGPRRVAWRETTIVEWQQSLAVGVRIGPRRVAV